MNELERFWHWHDNEKPEANAALEMLRKVFGATPEAVMYAAELIRLQRAPGTGFGMVCGSHERDVIREYSEALRDLSLTLEKAMLKMRQQVPEGPYPVSAVANRDDTADAFAYAMQMAAQQRSASPFIAGEHITGWYRPAHSGSDLMHVNEFQREYMGEWQAKPKPEEDTDPHPDRSPTRWRCINPHSFERDSRGCDECLQKPCRNSGAAERKLKLSRQRRV